MSILHDVRAISLIIMLYRVALLQGHATKYVLIQQEDIFTPLEDTLTQKHVLILI